MRHQHLKALRHIEIDRRRDVAEVAYGSLDGARHRLSFVDIERAAVKRARVQNCDCCRRCGSMAANRAEPAARRADELEPAAVSSPGSRTACAAVLMTPFGWPVEPDVNRIFAIVSGPTLACAASTAAVGSRADSSANARHRPVACGVGSDDHLDVRGHGRGDGARERRPVRGEDQAGCQDFHDALELLEILRHQRIGHGDRRIGNADMHRGKAEKRMLDIVAGQDRDRPIRRKITLQQSGGDRAHGWRTPPHKLPSATAPAPSRCARKTRSGAAPAQ